MQYAENSGEGGSVFVGKDGEKAQSNKKSGEFGGGIFSVVAIRTTTAKIATGDSTCRASRKSFSSSQSLFLRLVPLTICKSPHEEGLSSVVARDRARFAS